MNKLLICSNHGDDWRVAPFFALCVQIRIFLTAPEGSTNSDGGAASSRWRQKQPVASMTRSESSCSKRIFVLAGFRQQLRVSHSLTDDLGELFLVRMAGNAWRSLVRSTVFIPGFRPPKLCVLQMNGAVCVC